MTTHVKAIREKECVGVCCWGVCVLCLCFGLGFDKVLVCGVLVCISNEESKIRRNNSLTHFTARVSLNNYEAQTEQKWNNQQQQQSKSKRTKLSFF